MTNPAGAQIVNAVGPIRQIVDPAKESSDDRRYLAVLAVEDGKLLLSHWGGHVAGRLRRLLGRR